MENSLIISKRKALKKAAARRLGVSVDALEWADGRLMFVASNRPVEGVEKVSKPARRIEPAKPWEQERYWR